MSVKYITSLFRIVSLSLLLLLQGCVYTLMKRKQTVTVQTTDRKAKLYVNNKLVADGYKGAVKLNKLAGTHQILIRKEGHFDYYDVIRPQKRNPVGTVFLSVEGALALLPLLCIDVPSSDLTLLYPNLVSLRPGAAYKKRKPHQKYAHFVNFGINLKNDAFDIEDFSLENNQKAEANMMDTSKVFLSMRQRSSIPASLNTNTGKKLDFDDSELQNQLNTLLLKFGHIDTINEVFKDNHNTLKLEGYIIGGGRFTVDDKGHVFYFQRMRLDVKWYVLDNYGERIDSITTFQLSDKFTRNIPSRYFGKPRDYTKTMAKNALDHNFMKLYEHSKFLRYLKIDTVRKTNFPPLAIEPPQQAVQNKQDALQASLTIVNKYGGHGSGFAITNDGYILSNYHIIAPQRNDKLPDSVQVIVNNKNVIQAKVVRYDKRNDLLLLKTNYTFTKAFVLSAQKSYDRMMKVYTVGTPGSAELGQTTTMGLLSNERENQFHHLLQVNMNLNFGNSGGPLFDYSGHLHGIISSKLVGESTEGIAFAIPVHLIPYYLDLKLK